MSVHESVILRVWVHCVGCGRNMETSEVLPGESLRTGNTTQTARYWLDDMNKRIAASAETRRWERLEKDWRCAHCTAAEVDVLGKSVTLNRAAVAYIEDPEGKLLVVYNRRYRGWSLPGGKVEEGEAVEAACRRELEEETGMLANSVLPLYDGPHGTQVDTTRGSHVHVFRVEAFGEPREMEEGCPVKWLTRAEFLASSPFAAFYEKVFTAVPPRPDAATLECNHCGCDAIASGSGYFQDGVSGPCMNCSFPGHVSVDGTDDDPDENSPSWVCSEDPDARCKDPECGVCCDDCKSATGGVCSKHSGPEPVEY
jgi:8-oxo-dGTP pyrophosphatase MutT (NUDIX family)